ncbi:ABC transporter ATP-binding protein [Portibacter lacus]|uniref:ABC transporter ATP-binding protein n=1 Tax=Portibacter lacus TaxID=1099794 RepID=UPI0024E06890|nr:ATP-binding cassette domain-containing protein [Portibacter lacus]
MTFSYHSDASFAFPDISCNNGESCLILGKSGVGKTTLLHLLGGLIKPKTGEIIIDGQDITSLSSKNIDQYRGQNIGIVFQKPHFIASINILSNLLLTQKLAGRKQDKNEILAILENLEIKHRAYAKPNTLSQGELQRASVARAVLNKPKVILADEPTSALDDQSCEQVIQLLQKTAVDLDAALLIVTHDGRLKDIVNHQILLG